MTRRHLHLACFLGLASISACGDDGASGPDAATVQGAWTVSSQTVGGTATPAAALDGALVIGASDFAFATAEPLGGILGTYALSGDGHTLVVTGGPTVPITLDATPKLTLTLATDRTVVAVPDHAQPASTISVKGTVTAPTATPGYTKPTAFVAFLSRDEPGFVDSDTRNYMALTFTGATATFDFELAREALGTERIVFGPPAVAVAIAFVVVFDDRHGQDGKLDDLFASCDVAALDTDCVIGLSPLALTFRKGTSPELTASPYAYVRDGGWSQAVIVTDGRGGGSKDGLVSLDGGKVVPFDVALWDVPSAHAVPSLDLTVP